VVKTITYVRRFSADPKRNLERFLTIDYNDVEVTDLFGRLAKEDVKKEKEIEWIRRSALEDIGALLLQPHSHYAHYAVAGFEGIRVYEGDNGLAIVNFERNAARFRRTQDALFLTADSYRKVSKERDTLPDEVKAILKPATHDQEPVFVPEWFDAQHLYDVVEALIRANTHAGNIDPSRNQIYVRPVIARDTHSEGKLGVLCLYHDIIMQVIIQEWPDYLPNGLKLFVPECGIENPLRRTKCGANYAEGAIIKNRAHILGFDDGMFTDNSRNICEATGANVFVFFGDRLVTPPTSQYILPGITRELAIEVAKNMGITVHQENIPLEELANATCMSLTGTATGARSVGYVWDAKGKRGYTMNPEYAPFIELQREITSVITGRGEVCSANKPVQARAHQTVIDLSGSYK